MKMATKLHEGKCCPCHLCEQESTKYTHLEKKDCVVAKLICDLFMQRSVYMPCTLQTSMTNVNIPTFQPHWKSKQALPENLVRQKVVPFAI